MFTLARHQKRKAVVDVEVVAIEIDFVRRENFDFKGFLTSRLSQEDPVLLSFVSKSLVFQRWIRFCFSFEVTSFSFLSFLAKATSSSLSCIEFFFFRPSRTSSPSTFVWLKMKESWKNRSRWVLSKDCSKFFIFLKKLHKFNFWAASVQRPFSATDRLLSFLSLEKTFNCDVGCQYWLSTSRWDEQKPFVVFFSLSTH